MKEDLQQQLKRQFTANLPPIQLPNKNYTLEADLATGWRPKFRVLGPIPFNFDCKVIDETINELTSFGRNYKERVIYLGYRYNNSFKLHQEMKHEYRFKHEAIIDATFSQMGAYFRKFHSNFKSNNFQGRLFKGMNPTLKTEEQVIFDSNFESGNLDAAIKVGENQYDLFMRLDTNTRGHVQWFNFTVKNNHKQKIKLNIVNFKKFKTLYNREMRPYIFSQYLKQTKGIGWVQGGTNVKYENKKLRYKFLSEIFDEEALTYNCLSFQVFFQTNWETLQIAYCPPFTYSDMLESISNLKKDSFEQKDFICQSILCQSLGGLNIPLLTITDPKVPNARKKCVLLWGRIHPGETCGSHMMNGFLKNICSDTQMAQYIREKVVFKVIPMLNPDGVVVGNFRTSLSGKDLNRQFKANYTFLLPQVKAAKDLVKKLKSEFKSRFIMFLDMHGHSVKKNVFIYGPEYDIWEKNYYKTRIFPKLISEKTQIFRYYSCIFRISDFKKTTARAVLLNYIPHCYTIQASVSCFYTRQSKKNTSFTPMTWENMGKIISSSVFDLMMLFHEMQEARKQIYQLKSKKTNKKNTLKNQSQLNSLKNSQKHIELEKKEVEEIEIMNTKMQRLIQQIKKEEKQKGQRQQEIGHQSDSFSEGGSDSEGSEDDIPEKELEQLHNKIQDAMKEFSDKFYHPNQKQKTQLKNSRKKFFSKDIHTSERLKSTRESRGIEMIASLRKKAEQLEKQEKILIGKRVRNEGRSMTTNAEKGKLVASQSHRFNISFQTYMKEFFKKD